MLRIHDATSRELELHLRRSACPRRSQDHEHGPFTACLAGRRLLRGAGRADPRGSRRHRGQGRRRGRGFGFRRRPDRDHHRRRRPRRGRAREHRHAFLGLPYAAPPTGNLRWRPPQPPAHWQGVRDATSFAPSCPQNPSANPFLPPGPTSEDCLYLNVYTPTLRSSDDGGRPVLVWIHGGGLTQDAGRNYDPAKLAADGIVVVTINYRLGALGFLAHPALASRPGGPAGNYGLMDQQAALRWVQANIGRFGGDPHNVTIAGESAGGLSVLAQLVSRGSRGLFQRAIIQSGSFALNQQSLAAAEAAGEAFAAKAGCPDQTAQCLRNLPVVEPASTTSPALAIPGVVDGEVLTEPIGTALAAGRFARVPILNGTNHDEERIFVTFGRAISGGTNVPIPGEHGDRRQLPDATSPRCWACPPRGPRRSRPSTRSPRTRRRPWPSARWSGTPASRARRCRWTGGRPGACRPSPTSSTTTPRRCASRRRSPPARGDARVRAPVPVRPAERAGPRHAERRPAGARGQHAQRPGRTSRPAATRRPRPCPGPRSAARTARPCCRSCRHSHSSRPTSPPGTTARSGPPGNSPRQGHESPS